MFGLVASWSITYPHDRRSYALEFSVSHLVVTEDKLRTMVSIHKSESTNQKVIKHATESNKVRYYNNILKL